MQRVVEIGKALGDETRVRVLGALVGGELCLCQLVELLGLAPSTVSKHMEVLRRAGLVTRRKEGKWHYFRLVGKEGEAAARGAVRWVRETLKNEPAIKADAKRVGCLRRKGLEEVSACYRGN